MLTLLYNSLSGDTAPLQSTASSGSTLSFKNSSSNAASEPIGSLSRHDLLIAIPSSAAR